MFGKLRAGIQATVKAGDPGILTSGDINIGDEQTEVWLMVLFCPPHRPDKHKL